MQEALAFIRAHGDKALGYCLHNPDCCFLGPVCDTDLIQKLISLTFIVVWTAQIIEVFNSITVPFPDFVTLLLHEYFCVARWRPTVVVRPYLEAGTKLVDETLRMWRQRAAEERMVVDFPAIVWFSQLCCYRSSTTWTPTTTQKNRTTSVYVSGILYYTFLAPPTPVPSQSRDEQTVSFPSFENLKSSSASNTPGLVGAVL